MTTDTQGLRVTKLIYVPCFAKYNITRTRHGIYYFYCLGTVSQIHAIYVNIRNSFDNSSIPVVHTCG